MPRRTFPPGTRTLLPLGVALAHAGPLAVVALVLGAVTTFGMVTAAIVLGRQGADAPLAGLVGRTSSFLAWGAGLLLTFAATARALRRDREEGIWALARSRGASVAAYLSARLSGTALVVGVVVAGGTLITALTSALVAARGAILTTVQGGVASVAYGIAFAVTLTPVALAALGARSRGGGYLWLLAVLLIPELFIGWTARILPQGWGDLASIPRALAGVRAALMPPGIDVWALARAVAVLVVVIGVALLVVRSQVARLDVAPPTRGARA
jgi:hypothetical protein